MGFEEDYLEKLIELRYGLDVQDELKQISSKVAWAKGWPKEKKAFWNSEAFMWGRKIDSKKRKLIGTEIKNFMPKGIRAEKVLDVGCGSYSYFPCVGFDVSEKMLDFNDNLLAGKIVGDLEKKWPIEDNSFEFVSSVFVLNYIHDLDFLLNEIKRVLVKKGKFVAVLSAKGVSDLHQMHEKNNFEVLEWKKLLEKVFDFVLAFEKEDLLFFKCGFRG